MNYLGYVVAAYAVFVGVLAIDAIGSRLRLRRARQDARQRQQRPPELDVPFQAPALSGAPWKRSMQNA